MIPDYQVQLISFPRGKTKEVVTENEDGSYTIFIDCALSRIEQQERFLHALHHILGNDFDKDDVQLIEFMAHNYNIDISEEIKNIEYKL